MTGMDKALDGGAAGSTARDTYAAIIPKAVAASLQITPDDVGKVTVNFSGVPYLVIGIMDPDKFKAIKDLDNETLTPVDYQAQQSQSSSSATSARRSPPRPRASRSTCTWTRTTCCMCPTRR